MSYTLSTIPYAQACSKLKLRENSKLKTKKTLKRKVFVGARTLQCDNEFKTELTGIVKRKREIEEKNI